MYELGELLLGKGSFRGSLQRGGSGIATSFSLMTTAKVPREVESVLGTAQAMHCWAAAHYITGEGLPISY